jgi:hypothetical protein
MSRLFAFGCSFTNYRWSTWADCLAPEFDEYHNWGQSGAGNPYIFNSIMEADQRHHFGAGDTVIVCWSTALRDDRYVLKRWHTLGGMFNTPIYNTSYLKTHVDERGYLIRDIAYIKAIKVFLETKMLSNWKFLSMRNFKLKIRELTDSDDVSDVVELYQDIFDSILPSYQEILHSLNPNLWSYEGWKIATDPHPTPAEHLAYLDAILPGWVTDPKTRVKMQVESINLERHPLYKKDPTRSGMAQVERL